MIKEMLKMDKWMRKEGRIYDEPIARGMIFIIFFWFGVLKLFDASPASELVAMLLDSTFPIMDAATFLVLLGLLEVAIAIGFLFRDLTRVMVYVLIFHMFTTFLPLVVLPEVAWTDFLAPTLEGQYIIKNLIIVALAIHIGATIRPDRKKKKCK